MKWAFASILGAPIIVTRMLGSVVLWDPGVISIAVALSVAALIQRGQPPSLFG